MRHDKEKTGPPILDVSRKVYEKSLLFYPNDLRGNFGSEMIEVFDEQVSEAYYRNGLLGLLHVWFSVTREFVTVALLGRLGGRMLPIAAVTLALAFMVWFAGYVGYVMETACPGCAR